MSDDSARRGAGRRPMGRTAKILLVAVVAVVVFLAWFVVRGVTAKVSPTTDYATELEQRTIAQIATSDGVPPTPNQWDVIMRIATDLENAWPKVAKEFPVAPEGFTGERWPDHLFDAGVFQSSDAVRQHMREVSLQADVRAVLDRSALLTNARGYRTLPKGQALVGWSMPSLSAVRALARAMGAQMQLAAVDERWELAAQWYERTLGLGRVLSVQPTLIDRLVGVAIISHANERLRALLANTSPDDAALRAFDAALVGQLGIDELGTLRRIPPMAYAIENERISFMDTVQWCFTDDGGGDGRLVITQFEQLAMPTGRPPKRFINLTGSFVAGRRATVDLATKHFTQEVERSRATVQQRQTMPTVDVDTLPRTQMFVRLMLPALSSAVRSGDQMQLDVIGTRLVIALERHRIRTGTYPAALRDLTPVEAAFIPADPFSTVGLQYRVEGATYVLYSPGLDNTDDGGKVPEKDSERFYPLNREGEGKGYDFILGAPKKE